jgi:aminoglycoside 6'-N-acetyltransferase I
MTPLVRPLHRDATTDRAEWFRMRSMLHPDADNAHDATVLLSGTIPYEVFVALRDTVGLCGYIEVGERNYAEGCESSPVPYIESWWVDEDYRKRGVGRALVDAAQSWARARGHVEIASDAVIDNKLSHKAHRALGFDEVERIVVFRKDLT